MTKGGEVSVRSAFWTTEAHQDTASHEEKRDDGPDDSPACRASTVALGKDRGVRFVDLAEDEVVKLSAEAGQRGKSKVEGRSGAHDVPNGAVERGKVSAE
jgi:hypothetical protein